MKDIETLPWNEIHDSINQAGFARIPGFLSPHECKSITALYGEEMNFRSTIKMERCRFGKGEYKYFKYPLPSLIQQTREKFYPRLAPLANQWNETLRIDSVYPDGHAGLIAECGRNGQERPTPLILRYEAGGYNTLHQDLYGAVYFPFQVVLALSEHGKDFTGGEFVLVEQLPRAQSKAIVVQLAQGDALVFTTNFRPVNGTKGFYRARVKHGISEVKSGVRFAMGVIFHDAA